MEISHQTLAKMCVAIDNANFARPETYKVFQDFARPIIDKVNMPRYRVSKKEAEFLLKYYARQSLMFLGVGKKIDIKIYSKAKMKSKYARGNGKAIPDGLKGVIAVSNPTDSKITYSEQLIDDIASGNPDEMYRAFRTIMHETKHIEQAYRREYSISGYIMALETMAMHVDPFVYLNNYWGTYRECDAEKYGIDATQTELPGLYRVIDKRKLRENWINFKAGLSGQTKTIIGRVVNDYGSIMLSGSEYPEGERIKILELIAEDYIKKYPKKAFEEYPVLRLAFKNNGKRKSISELLGNMQALVDGESSIAKTEAIETLYITIITNRFPVDYENESAEAFEFIRNNRMKKIFIERLENAMYSMRDQDLRKREIERDFSKYGVGMSRTARFRRREYFKSGTKRKLGVAYASQYYLEPGKEKIEQHSISEDYKIDVPIIDNTNKSINHEESANSKKETQDESR